MTWGGDITVHRVSGGAVRELGRVPAAPADSRVEGSVLARLLGGAKVGWLPIVLRLLAANALRKTLNMPLAAETETQNPDQNPDPTAREQALTPRMDMGMFDRLLSGWLPMLVIAPFIGSFLGVLVHRLPLEQSWVAGRSACPKCGHVLGPFDLVPLLSWLVLRGHCRHCQVPISGFYPLMELAALAIAGWAATELSGWLLWVSCALGWTLLVLAVVDVRHMYLPDELNLPLAVGGLAVAWGIGGGVPWDAAIGAAGGWLSFAGLSVVYRRVRGRDGLGLGDAKLAMAAGAWVTWVGLPTVVALAALGVLAVVLARALACRPVDTAEPIPFGPYLAAGLWLVWLYGPVSLA